MLDTDSGWKILLFLCHVSNAIADSEANEALAYLEKFGYVAKPPSFDSDDSQKPQNSPALGSALNISEAVRKFQNFAGLSASGTLDSETLEFMKKPRCGVKDFYIQSDSPNNIAAPYKTRNKWTSKSVLSWRVTKFSSKLTRSQVVNSVWKAFSFSPGSQPPTKYRTGKK